MTHLLDSKQDGKTPQNERPVRTPYQDLPGSGIFACVRPSNEGKGILALARAKGVFEPGEVFQVTAYVNNPLLDETLTLNLPAGFRLVEGNAILAVPLPPPGAQDRRSVVTWKVSTDE